MLYIYILTLYFLFCNLNIAKEHNFYIFCYVLMLYFLSLCYVFMLIYLLFKMYIYMLYLFMIANKKWLHLTMQPPQHTNYKKEAIIPHYSLFQYHFQSHPVLLDTRLRYPPAKRPACVTSHDH